MASLGHRDALDAVTRWRHTASPDDSWRMGLVGDSTMDHLTWTYGALRDAWHALSTDQNCDESAPWNQPQPGVAKDRVSERVMLLTMAEWSAANAGKSVLHHLRLLALAYPPVAFSDEGVDSRGWPGFASYTVARALLEGAAVIDWLLQADPDERCCRAARLQLWSVCEQRRGGLGAAPGQPGSVERVRAIVEGAGFEVREYGRQAELGVVTGGQPRGFYPSQAVVGLLGERGKVLYHGWSGSSHHAPWALMPWTSMRVAEDDAGLHLSTFTFEDKHVELAADVTEVLRAAGNSLGRFYGRNTNAYDECCVDVGTHLRSLIPVIRRALGRPDGDPITG